MPFFQVGSHGIEAALVDVLRETTALDRETNALTPTLEADAALEIAVEEVSTMNPGPRIAQRNAPQLTIFAPEVLDLSGPPRLAWQVDVASPTGFPAERLLIDARDSTVLLRYSLAHRALDRQVFDAAGSSNIPATPTRDEGGPATGVADVDEVYDFSEDAYLFYADEHGRDSLDDAGHSLVSVVRYCPGGNCATVDAYWDGSRAVYTVGMTADDVVGHELTHGVTQYTSDLIYLNKSGAINESFSDIWGEFIDLTNNAGTDTSLFRWFIGEDATTGILRDMAAAYGTAMSSIFRPTPARPFVFGRALTPASPS